MASRPVTCLFRPSALSRTRFNTSISTSTSSRIPRAWQRTLTSTTSSQATQPQQKHDSEDDAQLSQEIDSLFDMDRSRRNTTEQRGSDFVRSLLAESRAKDNRPSSADEFSQGSRQFGAAFSDPAKSGHYMRSLRKPLNWEAMNMPEAVPGSSAQKVADLPVRQALDEKDINWQRLNPSTGRTVELNASKGRDIVRGLSMLGSLLARNSVRNDLQRQKFHERPGLKRKRLKSERWRARFKIGFRDVTARVSELTRKGW